MSGINQFLKEQLTEMEGRIWVAPDIPEQKLNSAIAAFGYQGEPAAILGICDNTTFGSAKEGFLLTGAKLIYKDAGEEPIAFEYEDIDRIEHSVVVEQNARGKNKETNCLTIKTKSGQKLDIRKSPKIDLEKFAEIIRSAIERFEDFDEQNQLQPIEQLSEDLKTAYVKILVNMAFDDDGLVDDAEFSEILQLMTRLNIDIESRNSLRLYISDPGSITPVSELLNVIDLHTPDGMSKAVHISLVKDLISIHSSLVKEDTADFEFLSKHRHTLRVSDEEVELARMAVENDRKILDRSYSDKAIVRSLKDLSAKAGAVGVPLGAVYLSGSVVGLSASGITSGLAALGMGGVLGLSGMVTGIGAAIILGVIAYRGLKHISGAGQDEGDKRRELMLQEVIRQSQHTLNMVIEDINYLTKELSTALAEESVTREQFRILAAKLSQYTRASKLLSNKVEQAESDKSRLKSPEILDPDRLKKLTQGPQKSKYHDIILSFYEREVITEEKDGETIEVDILRLSNNRTPKDLDQLSQLFDVIGYSSSQHSVQEKVRGMLS